MYFQNLEFYENDNFQYLLIHKNGCTSVLKSLEDLNVTYSNKRNLNKIGWTVIRDPYERFMSGFNYDLERQNLKFEDIKLEQLFSSYHEEKTREQGNVKHSSSQIPYLINTNINWYVNIKDLSLFLKMHFDKEFILNKGKENKYFFPKEEINKYLHLDYKIYNLIINSPYLWEWQKGRIF
jgi:hypothetical protein